jgi:hypothetical protein
MTDRASASLGFEDGPPSAGRLSSAARDEIEQRLGFLKSEAREAGDSVNEASEQDLRTFIDAETFSRVPNLYLVDNGNFRAVWKGPSGEQIGLQFLGGGTVQFVIFARRTDTPEIVRSAGRDSFNGIERQISCYNLDPIVGR